MFESLSDRLQDVFQSIRGEARLTERRSRRRCARSGWRCSKPTSTSRSSRPSSIASAIGPWARTVLKSLTPAQQVVAIVRDEMLALFGDAKGGLPPDLGVAARDSHAGSAGLRQDDHRRGKLARLADAAGAAPDAWCPPTSAGRPPSSSSPCSASRPACASTIRRATGSGGARQRRAGRGEEPRLRHGHRRHRRPAAHRRRADERARRDQGGGRVRPICSTSPTR